MARWILIDSNSGYIFGDSADLDGAVFEGSPVDFARALEDSIGRPNEVDYEQAVWGAGRDGASGYYVYEAPADFPVVNDGQDQATIDAVDRTCAEVCFVVKTPKTREVLDAEGF